MWVLISKRARIPKGTAVSPAGSVGASKCHRHFEVATGDPHPLAVVSKGGRRKMIRVRCMESEKISKNHAGTKWLLRDRLRVLARIGCRQFGAVGQENIVYQIQIDDLIPDRKGNLCTIFHNDTGRVVS